MGCVRCSGEQRCVIGGSTFLIRILYTQNATWQGTIEWIEGEKTKTFGSALELVSLINETLEKNMSTNCGSKIRSWKQ